MRPKKPKSVLSCSFVVAGATLETWITLVSSLEDIFHIHVLFSPYPQCTNDGLTPPPELVSNLVLNFMLTNIESHLTFNFRE